jgi:CheY-like chemotaxis protein
MDELTRRILVIDDTEAIHQDFRRLLCPERAGSRKNLSRLAGALFGPAPAAPEPSAPEPSGPLFTVDSAFQGAEGVARVRQAQQAGQPYALVFLDYRMPPGWNGVETLHHLWREAPSQRVVLCSAHSDYSWEDITRQFGLSPLLTELRKPFDTQQVRRIALALSAPP